MSDLQEAARLIRDAAYLLNASLKVNTYEPPQEARVIRIELDTAQTVEQVESRVDVGFPFKSYYVSDASDSAAYVKLHFNTKDSFQDAVSVHKKDSHEFESQQAKAFLEWPAQTGKWIELTFFVSSIFKSGTQVSEISSSIDANSRTIKSPVTVTTAETQILANASRAKATLYNVGPDLIYIGPSGVTSANGIPLQIGDYYVDRNTAELYGIANSGTAVVRIQTEA